MTREELLQTVAMEECAEVAHRLSKALRFGMEEIQPGQSLTNRERILLEFYDLQAAMDLLGFSCCDNSDTAKACRWVKQAKIEKYLDYSRQCGTVE